jgi:hypothetical protein
VLKGFIAAAAILTGVISFTQVTRASAARSVPAFSTDGQHDSGGATVRLEADAERAMQGETTPFPEREALVERLRAARDAAPGGEPGARLALLWLRAVKWMLAGIPLADRDGEPHNDWIKEHGELVMFSEPAGEWLIVPEVIWQIHDTHRESSVADEIAWLAVTNGLAGECEGYVPCDAHGLNALDGEYLRRHPRGAHVAEAVQTTKGSLEQSLRLLSEPDGKRFFDASHDCGDLTPPLSALRRALAESPASPAREETLSLADRLLTMCP